MKSYCHIENEVTNSSCCCTLNSQHAVGYVTGDEYYGAQASINVWAPLVENQNEFSLSQIWVISGSFDVDLNTIETGWQACYSH